MKLGLVRPNLGGFWLYDHEYRVHSVNYGQPQEMDGWLLYSDGFTLHVCCHHIAIPEKVFGATELERIVSSLDFEPRVINLWGHLGDDLRGVHGWTLAQLTREDIWAEVSVLEPGIQWPSSAAERADRTAQRLGYECNLIDEPNCTSNHYALLDRWTESHRVSTPDRIYTLGCMEGHKLGYAERIDVDRNGSLEGFAYITQPTKDDLVYLLGFFNNVPGGRAGDSLMSHLRQIARERGVRKLHLGYSYTTGLRKFKYKWGGVTDPRTKFDQMVLYREGLRPTTAIPPSSYAIRPIRWAHAQSDDLAPTEFSAESGESDQQLP